MAFHLIHFSKNLQGYVDVNLYLPVGTEYEDMLEPGEKFQTLWILHGGFGNFMEWPQYSAVEKLAMLNNFAVVSVDGANSGYNDMPNGENYYTYITEELPAFLRKHFPLSDKREDNFICGLSMGGIGTAKLGFANPDKYGAIGVFSGGPFDTIKQLGDMTPQQREHMFTYNAKPESYLPGGPNDVWANFKRLPESGYPMPVIYSGCGRQDFAFKDLCDFRDYVRSIGMEKYVVFEEMDGVHCWDVWDHCVHSFVDLLPLKHKGIWRQWYNERHPEAR